jgi:hypothetical protein
VGAVGGGACVSSRVQVRLKKPLAQPIFIVGQNGQMSARLTLFIGLIFSLLRVSELQATDIPEIVRKAKPAIVEVIASDAHGNVSSGTGFFITSDGLLLTNYHVIKNARTVGARTPSGAYYPFSGAWMRLPNVDIAILKFDANDVSYLQLDSNVQVEEGQRVLVIGNPEGLQGTVSDGLVAAIRENGQYIQITAPISHGSSGSPVLNEQGQVIGVATLILVDGQNLNFAISSAAIDQAMSRWASASATASATKAPDATSHRTTSLREFVIQFATSGNTASSLAEIWFYADEVDYFDNGRVTKAFVSEDIGKYNQRWPQRYYQVNTEPTIEMIDSAHDVARATVVIGFSVKNGQRTIYGTCQDTILIRDASTNPKIVSVRSQMLNRQEKASRR